MLGAKWEHNPNPNSYIWHLVMGEVGVHSTVDIAQETALSFDGTYEHFPYYITMVSPILGSCMIPPNPWLDSSDPLYDVPEFYCWKATSDGWLTVDLGGLTYLESIRLNYPENQIHDLKFSSTGEEVFSTSSYFLASCGFVDMINREEEFI